MSMDRLNPVVEWVASAPGERLLTVDELARQLRVSTRTIRRWSRYGLVSRRFVLAGRRRVGFLQSTVDRFLAHNEEQGHRGPRFSRMADDDREAIVDRVRCLAQTGGRLTEIAGQIAQETGYAARIMALPLDYIGNEQFTRPCSEKKEREILRTLPEYDSPAKKPRVPGGLPAYLASLYEVPLLTREQESHLFRKMNYLKCKASTLRAQLDLNRPSNRLMRQIEKLYDESVAAKTQIVRANLRLVVSIAKRYVRPTQDFFELVSDGNVSLLRAVDKFDFSRGNKFSTYASWAIIKNFARTLHDANRYSDRFRTNHSEMFSYTEDLRVDHYDQESVQIQRESQVRSILGQLDERERQIITARFGLIRGHEPLTLTQVGTAMGVSKERIRQLQVRAMSTLRAAAIPPRRPFLFLAT